MFFQEERVLRMRDFRRSLRSDRLRLAAASVALLVLLLLPLSRAVSQEGNASSPPRGTISILAYNVDNLFDAHADGTEYPEFNPTRGRWNDRLYHLRLENTAKVIRDSVPGGPDVVVLEEIENEHVLRTLADQYLSGLGFRQMVMVPVRRSAINVGVLTRFPVTELKAHEVYTGPGHPLRNILELHIDCAGTPLVLFACHWKSKSGGARETEQGRLLASRIIVSRVRDILRENPAADVVVGGDLNESVDEYERVGGAYQTAIVDLEKMPALPAPLPRRFAQDSIFAAETTGELDSFAGSGQQSDRPVVMFSPWGSVRPTPAAQSSAAQSSAQGSYWFRGTWETIDQFLLSPGLLDERGFSFRSFKVVAPAFLLNRSGHPESWQNARSSGYSDHLPILLTLTRREDTLTRRVGTLNRRQDTLNRRKVEAGGRD